MTTSGLDEAIRRAGISPVTVHGRAEPGSRVILEIGGKFLWPIPKVRRDLPDSAWALGVNGQP
ncbi:MAG TPA: hypothetical protein VK988_11860 [Acidimicrobiales bacterium]|nr:hypothetical protein [Acidimicrobiales bacterium]